MVWIIMERKKKEDTSVSNGLISVVSDNKVENTYTSCSSVSEIIKKFENFSSMNTSNLFGGKK
ncbi:uncharacterized protein CELE_T27A8.7 [Caenorhabditis elegans]|uniref:Uncharacterized protein n=1 Tax=Caenorhabditis elegans TaxID=6239 RepID=G3MTY8_CAEEL|nr:Uncharacterized protein CELE_T27A8.7 [Caenorhabditis elegans]CCD31124.1 Uncharacterized protein CELE_T27A8.7 [Caenorhabditis elegans]|eukprot:NP_001257270.1 Uncharacterized protein CELE_T27A8.7 [Caenorhabditis elegans]